jgi:hypothetical protein
LIRASRRTSARTVLDGALLKPGPDEFSQYLALCLKPVIEASLLPSASGNPKLMCATFHFPLCQQVLFRRQNKFAPGAVPISNFCPGAHAVRQ